MNRLDLFAQFLLAGMFLIAGLSKIFAMQSRRGEPEMGPNYRCPDLPHRWAWAIALLEIAGAIALVTPLSFWQPDVLPRVASAVLALLTLAICVYRVRRKEPAAPVLALFSMTLFVMIGRWY